jgi:hypothetical protein
MDKMEPADPIDRIDPAEPIDRIEPLDPIDRREPDEPPGRDEPAVLRMLALSQSAATPGRTGTTRARIG